MCKAMNETEGGSHYVESPRSLLSPIASIRGKNRETLVPYGGGYLGNIGKAVAHLIIVRVVETFGTSALYGKNISHFSLVVYMRKQ